MKIERVYSKLAQVRFIFDQSDIEKLMRDKIKKDYPDIALLGNAERVPKFEWGEEGEEMNPRTYCEVEYAIQSDIKVEG